MGIYEESICELYDENQSRHQIRAIAKMYNADVGEVERILTQNGRALPANGKKSTIKEVVADPVKDDTQGHQKNVPDAVKRLIFNRLDEIDKEIINLNQRIATLEEAKTNASAEYKVLADYISIPFGAGNLSQEGSDNMIESPQASA